MTVVTTDTLEIRDPENGLLVGTVARHTRIDAVRAIEIAVRTQPLARSMPTHERIRILLEAAARVQAQQEEFAQLIAREGIKTIREARKEASRCVDTLRISAEESRRLGGETINFDQRPGSEGRMGFTTREPIGIIAAITPFNDPLNLVAHKLGPAIAAGNVVILKPHPQTPLVALKLAGVFADAGLPVGMLQVLTGESNVAEVLVDDPRVRMVSFTGGRDTGERIARAAGIKKLALELGSNCPTIIMPDADLEGAVEASVSGAFWTAGQNCLHVQRLIVHQDVYQPFKMAFLERTANIRLGAKLDETTNMGCLVSIAAAERVERTLLEAIRRGAVCLTGGTRNGTRFTPTVLEQVPHDTRLYQEEIYAPVTMLEPFTSLDEAIRLANSVDYGLQAAIFTRDLETAMYATRALQVGAVIVNDSTDYRIDAMPFGGVKGSGLGREGIRNAILEMTEEKVACFNLSRVAVTQATKSIQEASLL